MRAFIGVLIGLAACSGQPASDGEPDAAASIGDASVDAPRVAACTAPGPATYRFQPETTLAKDFVGFGSQFNGNVYADISAAAGVNAQNIADMEAKAIALAPRHVRIFWDANATPDEVASFERTVALADHAGATINVTYWHGPYPDPTAQMTAFAEELVRLRDVLGIKAVRYITIQNEVNSTMVTMPLYEQLYRIVDTSLRSAGARDDISFVCGDLLRDGQAAWFDYMATHMTDVCDGYSVHIYWNYSDVAYMVTRLTEVHDIVAAMPAAARKPVYVTEFGVRGDRPANEASPGLYSDGELLGRTNENAFQHAWFNVLATRLGMVSTLKWDAFFAKYDLGTQFYSTIGVPPAWTLKPVYYAMQLFDRVVPAGWASVAVPGGAGNADTRLVTGFTGPNGDATVIALNKGAAARQVDVTGLPPATKFELTVWHGGDGNGALTTRQLMSTTGCQATFTVPARSVAAITTL